MRKTLRLFFFRRKNLNIKDIALLAEKDWWEKWGGGGGGGVLQMKMSPIFARHFPDQWP